MNDPNAREPTPASVSKAKMREIRCQRCQTEFASALAGDRICPSCRKSSPARRLPRSVSPMDS